MSDGPARPRVAVTGLGVLSPAGNDVPSHWNTLLAGRSTASRITSFDPSGLLVDFACQVTGFDATGYLNPKDVRRMDRTTQLGVAAATDALADAGPLIADPGRRGIVAGTGHGGIAAQEAEFAVAQQRGYTRVRPHYVPVMMPNATTGVLSMMHGLKGPSLCISTACASSAHAIGEAARMIRDGSADAVLAGGAEAPITPITVSAFASMGALSRRAEQPERASRPFDSDRDGFVMGEGAGFLVLERWDHAVARGALIHAELVGYGRNSDAHHLTAPSPDGEGARNCMLLALGDAGLDPGQIVHINAHGTSTPLNDVTEATAITEVFGPRSVPITASKSVIGHLIGAGGAVEAVTTVITIREGLAHPTANLEQQDPRCPADVVHTDPRKISAGPVMSNSFGFGGHNASLVFAPAVN